MEKKEQSLKALTVMLRAAQSLQDVMKQDMVKYGLNPTEFAVLELLYSKGEQKIQHIGKKILLSSSSMTYVIDKLEQKGHIERKPCATDRRVIFAHITDKGKAFMEEAFPLHEEMITDLFSVLSSEEVETLIPLVKKVGLTAAEQSTKNK
ncbi:MarR family transcriptional regulator [Desemzia sp. RIT804]|uniref:MarR family winged helix-turn-helix transcriptional regulator n=1 Tax=Desemzia sp. RIT 804 TaxID=2810209 RepID=UPI0019507763|nr:MarR family transcriptional regulator [Desemzia sp. RIT 804]MBM6613952.1 MarR family transcriptional regulator [Desemzia sp. RIT 804]